MAKTDDSGDWRLGCKDVQDIWIKAAKQGILTDVKFIIREKQEFRTNTIRAHKTILSLSSPGFAEMLSKPTEDEDHIMIPDQDFQTFTNLIWFCYGVPDIFRSPLDAAKTIADAEKYKTPILKKKAEDYILNIEFNDTSFWEAVSFCEIHTVPCLLQRCCSHFAYYAESLTENDLFKNLTFDVIMIFIQQDTLNISEIDLIMKVGVWASINTKGNFNKMMKKFVKFFRFASLTLTDLRTFMDSFPEVVDENDIFLIKKYLQDPNGYELPRWCCKIPRQRPRGKPEQRNSTVEPLALRQGVHKRARISSTESIEEEF